jgi:hypothetical protein
LNPLIKSPGERFDDKKPDIENIMRRPLKGTVSRDNILSYGLRVVGEA